MVKLFSAYREEYDPFPALDLLKTDRATALDELYENLHHQGDVDTASYAAIPALVNAGELDLVCIIEICRYYEGNPVIPEYLIAEYTSSIEKAIQQVPKDKSLLQSFYSLHASFNGHHDLAQAINLMSIQDVLEG